MEESRGAPPRIPARRGLPGTLVNRTTLTLQEFLQTEAAGGILLLAGAIAGLAWANSPFRDVYLHLREIQVGLGVGTLGLTLSVEHWVNDGLMALFFFVVGLEIKRELLVGELASPGRAFLPVAAAVGGALLPAGLYLALNAGGPHTGGWGIPMATDIAFAVGILALLGRRVPNWLRTFLVALAIADDLIAVLVIALFYTSHLAARPLAVAAALLALLAALNLLGVRRPVWYVVPGVAVWAAVLASGVHATVAGVAVAAMIPARSRTPPEDILSRLRRAVDLYASSLAPSRSGAAARTSTDEAIHAREAALEELELATARWETPLFRLEHRLLPWTTYLVLPLFALVNAGVAVPPSALRAAFTSPLALGIVAGLLLGKPVGIAAGTWLAARLGPSALPERATWREVWGAALLGGVGFTMSLFIATLAFGGDSALDQAKIGILAGSTMAALAGWTLLRWAGPATS